MGESKDHSHLTRKSRGNLLIPNSKMIRKAFSGSPLYINNRY